MKLISRIMERILGWTGLGFDVRNQAEAGWQKFVYSYKLNLVEPFVDGLSPSHPERGVNLTAICSRASYVFSS